MGNVFGKEKPLKEQLCKNKRMITCAIRELDCKKRSLKMEEKRLTIEIKKMACENQMKAVKIMARDLVRTRQYVTKFIEMRSQLQGCALKLQTVKSHAAMAEAMSSTAIAMRKMNKAVDVPAINKMMAEFEHENMKSE
jgi:charged multivesicular body protein 2A